MKYKSELIKDIVDTRGHEKSSLHYESECIETWVAEASGAYPKLMDYQSEWLKYIVSDPIGEFPYITLSNVTNATVENVVPYAYKSAILKGSTKYLDINTGDILDAFDESKNLELVSVKMPVLTTTGKNLLYDVEWEIDKRLLFDGSVGAYIGTNASSYINVSDLDVITFSGFSKGAHCLYDKDKSIIGERALSSNMTIDVSGADYIRLTINNKIDYSKPQMEAGSVATSYEPHKSNILTVNGDVTLRSNGSVYDELDLLTGKLTQRIDENGEVLSQEIVKTVDLSIVNQDGNVLMKIKPIEGTMYLKTNGEILKPTFTGEVPVEAITQNLASFIKLEMEE